MCVCACGVCVCVCQLIPQISALTPLTTIIPLFSVLAMTALKDAYDDLVSPAMATCSCPQCCHLPASAGVAAGILGGLLFFVYLNSW